MKNLKNIIASIILVVISFVSYTQDTLKYEFYLTDNTDTVNTFEVTNTVTQGKFSLSEYTMVLGKLDSTMNFTMNDTIYKSGSVYINSPIIYELFLLTNNSLDVDNYKNDLNFIVGEFYQGNDTTIEQIGNVEDFITTLMDTSKTYTHVVFSIGDTLGGIAFVGFAIDYTVDATSSIDTEVIEVSNTRVYPNPVMNSLNIEFETINTDTEVEIYSTNGQLMYKDVEYRNFGINKVSVDMSNYQSGMYIVRLGNEVKKVIKQ